MAKQLPVELTSFVGRQTEIETLLRLLEERRLTTLTGSGGCGKTRLANQAAALAEARYPDGTFWVDLAPLSDPTLVSATLAGALGLRSPPRESITDTAVSYLEERRSLVILDNCEHLLTACAELASRVVAECPDVAVLATSRERLGVPGEALMRVPPLSVPEGESGVDAVRDCEAVRLFADRAGASQPGFVVTEKNAAAVAEICTRLDGIPLAIELAAARARLLSVDEIATGLTDRFRLLTGGTRWALPRQRTLEASIAWSHDLLSQAERVVFRRLGVFAGSFTLDAAEATCSGGDVSSSDVFDHLSGLVDRSLVEVIGGTSGQTRYRLLETVRDFARRQVIEAGDLDSARDRHLDFSLAFAENASAGLEGRDLIDWLARIDAERDNLRMALDWGAQTGDPNRGVRLVGLLMLYWFARSDLAIGRGRLEAAALQGPECALERPAALSALCIVNYRAGDMARAADRGDEAVALAHEHGDTRTLGRALHWRAWVRCWGEGDRRASWRDFEEAATHLRKSNDPLFGAMNLALFAWSYIDTSEAPKARPLLDEALALAGRVDAPHARCYSHLVSGAVELAEGHLESAAEHLGIAIGLAEELDDHYPGLFGRGYLALTHVFQGDYRRAREECEDGLATALEHRSPMGEAVMRMGLGQAAFAEGDLGTAADQLETACGLFSDLWAGAAAICRAAQAGVALARSESSVAHRYAIEAQQLAEETGVVTAEAPALSSLASLAQLDGDAHGAEDLLHRALDLTTAAGHRLAACGILDRLGGVVADQDRPEEAARILGAAEGLRSAIGSPRFPVDQQARAATTAGLHATLGASALDDALTAGAAMTLGDAVAYARRGRGQRGRARQGWNSLTPTELRVVALVTKGLTNPQIGERLFISRRTVQTHLSHIFAKLGLTTRSELAAHAAERAAVKSS